MKCVITGKDTNSMMKGFPLSRKGRDEFEKLITEVNEIIKDSYTESVRKGCESEQQVEFMLKQFSPPSINKKQLLVELTKRSKDEILEKMKEVHSQKEDSNGQKGSDSGNKASTEG